MFIHDFLNRAPHHPQLPRFRPGHYRRDCCCAGDAAKGWLGHGFGELRIDEVVAYTATTNRASVNVMKRIGMRRDAARDFDHPRVAEGHPLRPQIVYSVMRTK